MEKFKALLSRRFLGVPAGVFVLLGAAVVLFFAYRMRSSGDVTGVATATDATPAGDTGSTDDTQQPDFSALPDAPSATPVVTTTATNDTNDLWQRRAITWLMSTGYSLQIATNSISKYLSGDPLTTEEGKARDAAVAQFGLPPESVPDVIQKSSNPTSSQGRNTPATKQGEPPLNHKVVNGNDNTPSELAVLYYGTNDKDATSKIESANTTLVTPYAPGTSVHIPQSYYPHYYTATGHTKTIYEIARKNSTTPAKIEDLNPGMKFPVKVGTRVRVH